MNTYTAILTENEKSQLTSEDVKNCDTPPPSDLALALTKEGNTWLQAPLRIEPGTGTANDLAAGIEAAFNISHVEALTAVVGALSLAVGPGIFIQNPFGGRLPLSIQFLIATGANPNFDRAARHLCQEVIEAYATEFGQEIFEDGKSLLAQQLESEKTINQRVKVEHPVGGGTVGPKTPGELTQGETANILKYYRILRKQAAFPFGNVVSSGIICELAADNGDFCFGSFSPDGGALRHVLEAQPAERMRILNFLNAGFEGELFTHNLELPVYPVAAAIWHSAPDLIHAAITKDVLSAMPGALVVAAEKPSHGKKLAALTVEHRKKWRHLLQSILQTLRLPLHRRYTKDAEGYTCSLNAEATESFTAVLEWERFATGPGHAQSLLAKSPEQVLKIASLLNIEPISPEVIGRKTVLQAMEIFRWLARGTLDVVAKHETIHMTRDVEKVTEKLRNDGPMSLRSLTRSFHRMTYERASAILLVAIQSGKVEGEKNFYRAVR